jgi:hypothetical protein
LGSRMCAEPRLARPTKLTPELAELMGVSTRPIARLVHAVPPVSAPLTAAARARIAVNGVCAIEELRREGQ